MDVIVYTKRSCSWCERVTIFLREKNIPYEEREVYFNPSYMDELIAKSGETKTPTLDIDGEMLVDTDKEQLQAYLRQRGMI
ncbi:MAG: glutaredoxin domain-containing protein [Patescibacteria group bacterium]